MRHDSKILLTADGSIFIRMKQQTLPLILPKKKTFDRFVVGKNKALIDKLQTLDAHSAFYLWGDKSAGCSHLLQATCQYWQSKGWYTLYLDMNHTQDLSAFFHTEALQGLQLLAIDHFETHLPKLDLPLFNLFNRGTETPFAMLWAAHTPANALDCLPDLHSRLQSLLAFQIQPLEDAEKKEVLQRYAQECGFSLTEAVTQYLLQHYTRDLSTQLQLLQQLDQATMEEKRPLTIPFVKKWLQ